VEKRKKNPKRAKRLGKKPTRGVRIITDCDAGDWRSERLAIYDGNLKRGSRLRELRCDCQVTMWEVAEFLWDNAPEHIPANIYSISTIERGIRHIGPEEYAFVKQAILQCKSGELATARRKVRAQRAKDEMRRAARAA
jgi:hypothetical protein